MAELPSETFMQIYQRGYQDGINARGSSCKDVAEAGRQLSEGIKAGMASAENPNNEWIPIKFRPLTEEEKERWPSCFQPVPDSEEAYGIYDCRLPDDGEEVLITTRWGAVCIDTFHRDEGSYFEDHDDVDDVTAWKHLPKPYKPEEEDDT